ncbi:MAG: toprim domain-containing protein, partial [Ruthenibacterium sp.]
ASEWMTADIYRDGMHYHLDFKHGENIGGLQKEPTTRKKTGSTIRWRPDTAVFTDINVPAEYYIDTIKRQAIVNAGVTFEFTDETAEGKVVREFCYEKGIQDYAEEIAGLESLTPVQFAQSTAVGRDREDRPDYKVKMSAAFCFSNTAQLLEYYHNSSWLEHGGSPERAVKTAFVNQIDAYLKTKNLYKKGESKISFTDVQDCLIYVSSSFSTQTSYENQTKKAIANKFIAQAMTEFLKHTLEVYFIEKPDEAQRIAQQVLVNKQSREHAEKARLGAKKTLTAQIDIANRVQKFVDCRSKDLTKRELYIVEGDSALGAVKTSRDSEYQAIMPVRGKILNCLKADYARIFKSDVITDLIKVLGCGVELSGGKNKNNLSNFDVSNLRWSKVIICTDADVDGYQIRTLILTMLYRLVPTLIEDNFVYIAESPLYEIQSKGRTYFAYTEQEKTEFMNRIGTDKYTLQRSKGLGENDPEMMWLTTMNPESRRLIQVTAEEAQHTSDVFDLLLGDNLAGRKEHIALHGCEYLDELDVS